MATNEVPEILLKLVILFLGKEDEIGLNYSRADISTFRILKNKHILSIEKKSYN